MPVVAKMGKYEESKQNQGLGHFMPSFNSQSVKKAVSTHDMDERDDTNALQRNISVCRPSIMSDVLTKDYFFVGWVEKQSPSLFKVWQKRYFVLKDRMLFYYKTKADYDQNKTCKGIINF